MGGVGWRESIKFGSDQKNDVGGVGGVGQKEGVSGVGQNFGVGGVV